MTAEVVHDDRQELELKIVESTKGGVITECPDPCYNKLPNSCPRWYRTNAIREDGHFLCTKHLGPDGEKLICDQLDNISRKKPLPAEES